MCFIKHYDKKRFMIHEEKKSIETKDKSELVFSQNNCENERGFVVLMKSVNNNQVFHNVSTSQIGQLKSSGW